LLVLPPPLPPKACPGPENYPQQGINRKSERGEREREERERKVKATRDDVVERRESERSNRGKRHELERNSDERGITRANEIV
jgi:hypothetical protein